jgi:hypothetical protein
MTKITTSTCLFLVGPPSTYVPYSTNLTSSDLLAPKFSFSKMHLMS